jgi:hypothetical protein
VTGFQTCALPIYRGQPRKPRIALFNQYRANATGNIKMTTVDNGGPFPAKKVSKYP